MKNLKRLFFDKEVVSQIRSAKVDANFLYNQLFAGKITMQEYLSAVKNA
ncbi:hypothetical protein [Parafilimonas terrae]|uniref:Antitoxin VbhA domain-containing protein n=1 Tax=Parafilimonas terrae TaxID=1465490 RepID=A0A1I5RE87_9BACT|nr:hypothetical protein [Parafilimonas terrae]SFP56657.1 hypothetical protein SAMN05444277_101202 [Parafilimonas terrae]